MPLSSSASARSTSPPSSAVPRCTARRTGTPWTSISTPISDRRRTCSTRSSPQYPCGHLHHPPSPERNYYILMTHGMGAHAMNVPEDLAGQKLERAELFICLPPRLEGGRRGRGVVLAHPLAENPGPPAHQRGQLAGLGPYHCQPRRLPLCGKTPASTASYWSTPVLSPGGVGLSPLRRR